VSTCVSEEHNASEVEKRYRMWNLLPLFLFIFREVSEYNKKTPFITVMMMMMMIHNNNNSYINNNKYVFVFFIEQRNYNNKKIPKLKNMQSG
jgi:hypothetical protein